MKLALYSATPLWIWGIFQLIPLGFLRTTFLLLSLGHASWLLFTGLALGGKGSDQGRAMDANGGTLLAGRHGSGSLWTSMAAGVEGPYQDW